MKDNLLNYMKAYLANIKAATMWFHAAHHVAKGAGFLSDHNDLYGKIYNSLDEHFDMLVEKSIALSGDESVACPLQLSIKASHVLNKHYVSPVNQPAGQIAKEAIEVIINLINSVSEIYSEFEEAGMLTLGLDDALSANAGEYEKYLYFLGQRYKS